MGKLPEAGEYREARGAFDRCRKAKAPSGFLGFWGLGFRVSGLGFGGLGFRV